MALNLTVRLHQFFGRRLYKHFKPRS